MATTSVYQKGDLVRCSGSFAIGGTNTDPTTVTFKYEDAGGTETSYVYNTDDELVKDSTGIYHVDVSAGSPVGIWYYRFESTGTGQAAAESSFLVEDSKF